MKRVLVLGLVVLLVIGSAVVASSQTPEWIVYNTDNSELPHDQVIALAFDAQGNLWTGTNHGGLVRFNEETWTVYNTDNSGLPSDQVTALLFAGQGILWVGTGDGLAKFDGETWMVDNEVNSGLPDNFIWILLIDTQGNTWIGTCFGGLAVYHEGGLILTGVQE